MKYPQLVSMPSAVSDWLEEQLEARGIDAVLYTRYILSLLHSDPVDVIYSDEDLHCSHFKKEVRRPAGSRKRFRRSSDWWKHAQADAEKLKRSAAVECLMSASEQTCGIESLIDELCEKLNEIKSDKKHVEPSPAKKANPELQKVSPQELAKRYYAAFPPLDRNTSATPSNLITLIPKWTPKNKSRKHDMLKARASRQRFGGYFSGRNKKEVRQSEKKPRSLEAEPSDWNMNDDANLYDDLPVDIKDLLDDSKSFQTEAMMNLANMRDTGRRGFIPCGTNITSSIWTNEAAMEETVMFDNQFNDNVLDLQFSSITINNKSDWAPREDECNAFFENSKPWAEKWSDDSGCEETLNNCLALSLIRLNHSKEMSAFAEVTPSPNRAKCFNPFSKIIGSTLTPLKTIDFDKDKDDLLTSIHSHFRPINEKLEGQYADGATFIVSNNWEKINYRRTDSGMYMENDYTMRKKYCEYKMKNGPMSSLDFVLKYAVCQNDKGCQTEEEDDAEVAAITMDSTKKKKKKKTTTTTADCTCRTLAPNMDYSCLCNNNSWCTKEASGGVDWQFGALSNIWSGGVVCHSCLGRPPSTLQHSKLREDVSQDGDQLLSDLSSLQRCYMQEESLLPASEYSCDISDFFLAKEQRKRRHSLMATTQEEAWSFASRLEEDCIIQMSTLPTLRSVTL